MTEPPRRRPGPDVDLEARAAARALKSEILAAGYTVAEVARLAGLTSNSDYTGAAAALRGEKTSRPAVRRMREAFGRLTSRAPQPETEESA